MHRHARGPIDLEGIAQALIGCILLCPTTLIVTMFILLIVLVFI